MSISERLEADLHAAMRAGESERTQTLRTLRSAIHYVEIDTRRPATDEEVIKVLQTEARRREEALAIYRDKSRLDRAAVEQTELNLIRAYLPAAVETEVIRSEATAVVAEVGANAPSDVGKVMSPLMARLRQRGTVDGKLVNQIVRELLERA